MALKDYSTPIADELFLQNRFADPTALMAQAQARVDPMPGQQGGQGGYSSPTGVQSIDVTQMAPPVGLSSGEAGAAYANTQNQRFARGTRMGSLVGIYDAVREKQLRGPAVTESNLKKDEVYKDALEIIASRYSDTPGVTPEAIKGMAKQAAEGTLDLDKLTPEVVTLLDIAKNKREIRAGDQTAKEGGVKIRNTFRDFSKKKMEGIDEIERQYEQFALYEPDASKATGAEQIGMLYNFVKALDPDSVVREGEVALVQQAANYMESIQKEFAKGTGANQAVVESLYREMYALTDKLLTVNRRRASGSLAQDFNMVNGEGYSPAQTYGEDRYNFVMDAMNTPMPAGITIAPSAPPPAEGVNRAKAESDDPLDALEAG